MGDTWGIVGAIVTAATFLPLLFSQTVQNQVSRSLQYLGRSAFPAKARCEALTWSAVRDGPLHVCRPMFCMHWVPGHSRRKECWRFVTDLVSSGTVQHQRQTEYVEKPEALDLFGVKESKSTSWREGAASYDDDLALRIRFVGSHKDVLLAHFSARPKQEKVLYSKAELTCLMNGYPPWYRERVVCAHGPSVPFPIRNDTDIARGGWVVAVGLTDSDNRKPMSLYTIPNLADHHTDGSYYARTNASHLRLAVQRVLEVLENIAQKIPSDPNLDAVSEAVQYMVKTSTGSGVERHLPGRRVTGGSISQLNAVQCIFAMTLFNGLVPTDADILTLRPILAPVLQAAFSGCYEVIQYLKDTGMRLVLPYGLGNDWSRKLYLRDCVVDEA